MFMKKCSKEAAFVAGSCIMTIEIMSKTALFVVVEIWNEEYHKAKSFDISIFEIFSEI